MYYAMYITEDGKHNTKSIGSWEGVKKLLTSLYRRQIQATLREDGRHVGGVYKLSHCKGWTIELPPGGKNV